MVAEARGMLLQQPIKHGGLEIAAIRDRSRSQRGLYAPCERTTKPSRQRDAESHLSAIQHLVGKVRLEHLFEDVFACPTPELHFRWQRGGPRDQSVVKQRYADFEAVRHAGAIHLGQDVPWKIGLEIQILGQRQRMVCRRTRRVRSKYFDPVVTLELLLEARTVESPAQRCRGDADVVAISLHIVPSERLECCLGSQRARRPIGFGINMSQPAEYGLTKRKRQPR